MTPTGELFNLISLFVLIPILCGHCDLLIDDRNECGYPGISKIECEDRNCCWVPFSSDDIRNPPWCSKQASNYCGYELISFTGTLQDRCNKSRTAAISIEYPFEDVIRVKISRTADEFQVPQWIYPNYESELITNQSKLIYENFTDQYGNFNFKISRNESNEIIWNSDINSPMKLKYLYTQFGSVLPSNHSIYGLGYHAGTLRIKPGSLLSLFARDSATFENQNLYGANPFFLQIPNGKAHGVYLRNSFGMDILVDDQTIKFKALGGPIDLFFFSGPTPLDVIEQYTRIVGRPKMMDYRILGFHQSRYGYKNISQIRQVVEEYNKAEIPLDHIWFDIDYMNNSMDFTFDNHNFPEKELDEFINFLLKTQKRIVPILDPGIKIDSRNYEAYDLGISKGIFIRNPKCSKDPFYIGQVWPGNVHFIDFMNEKTFDYWRSELIKFFKMFKKKEILAGLWLDMNEPSNFIDGYNYTFYDLPTDYLSFSLNFPRYLLNNGGKEVPIYQKTVPMDTETGLGTSYQTHNMYGLFESILTYKALHEIDPKIRPFLLTRSTFPGSGQFTATWLGDNFSTFSQLALSISGVLQYGLEGIPISGPDICGFLGDTNEELCARWMVLGAFYPFARNHNSISSKTDQEPFRWKSVADASRKYLRMRYSLFPFYYTLMHLAHKNGWPIWRPIFFYDKTPEALNIDDQFFVGKELLISPILFESSKSINVRLPVGEWYEWETFNFIKTSQNPIHIVYNTTKLDFIPIHLRSGSVILMQDPKLNLFETRKTNFTLLIALNSEGKAFGTFYWDDGISFDVEDQFTELLMKVEIEDGSIKFSYSGHFGYENCPLVEKIVILTAGKHDLKPENNEDYIVKRKSFGFELEFKSAKRLQEIHMTKIGKTRSNLIGCL